MTTADESCVEEMLERMTSQSPTEQDLIAALFAIACVDMTAAQMKNTAIAALTSFGALDNEINGRP